MSAQPSLPDHVAIIMDGNRRWAKKNKLQIFKGHDKVAQENIEQLTRYCLKLGISYLTLWAFSTENWRRDKAEIEAILSIMRKAFNQGFKQFIKEKVRVKTIGDLTRFPQDIQQSIRKLKQINVDDYEITVIFALNYGGRDEIIRAIKKISSRLSLENKMIDSIDQNLFSSALDTSELPDPDLIIRTGGERRLSGFLPWQSVYAELYFTDVLMPDFDRKEFEKALQDYQKRERRFGR